MTDEEYYIKSNWGECLMSPPCHCLKTKNWIGLACSYWKPVEYKTTAEMNEGFRKQYEKSKSSEG